MTERLFELRQSNKLAAKILVAFFVIALAMVMAFVLVVGGGFGISYSVSDKASMGIYIANANEVANIKKATPQDFTYQIYISEGNKNAMNKWQKDKQKLLDDAERLGNDNYTASVNSSSSNATNE